MLNIFSAFKSVIELIRSLAPSSAALICNKYAGVSCSRYLISVVLNVYTI